MVNGDSLTDNRRMSEKVQNHLAKGADRSSVGLYNEAGRDELKTYEAEYEASLNKVEQSKKEYGNGDQQSDDEYDDGIDFNDVFEDYDDNLHENADLSDDAKAHDDEDSRDSSDVINAGTNDKSISEEVEEASTDSFEEKINSEYSNSRRVIVVDDQSTRKASSEKLSTSKRKVKRRKFSGTCSWFACVENVVFMYVNFFSTCFDFCSWMFIGFYLQGVKDVNIKHSLSYFLYIFLLSSTHSPFECLCYFSIPAYRSMRLLYLVNVTCFSLC